MDKTKFALGQVVITNGVDRMMNEDEKFKNFCLISMGKFINLDWGDVCKEDWKLNDQATLDGERIMGVYIYPKDKNIKIWIITEADRSYTTILFPEEY